MTPQQKHLLDFIRDTYDRTGITPSYDEMVAHSGFASKSGVSRLIAALEADGHVIRGRRGQPRGLRLPGVNLAVVPTSALQKELARRERRA